VTVVLPEHQLTAATSRLPVRLDRARGAARGEAATIRLSMPAGCRHRLRSSRSATHADRPTGVDDFDRCLSSLRVAATRGRQHLADETVRPGLIACSPTRRAASKSSSPPIPPSRWRSTRTAVPRRCRPG